MVLREKDDAEYFYNVYKDNPTQENLDQLIKYRPQDHNDQLYKDGVLAEIREEKKQKEKTYQTTLLESIRRMKLQYKFHPIANIFPLMSQEELDSLEISLTTNGFLTQFPVLLFEDKILDGRNRYYLSNKLKINPIFEKFKGTKEEALEFVWSSNFPRRHLSSVQKVLAIQSYREIQSQLAKKRQLSQLKQFQDQEKISNTVEDSEASTVESEKNNRKPQTRDIIADKIKTSPHTVDTITKATKMEEEHPEIKTLLDKARKGDKSITVKRIKKEIGKIETEQKREEKLIESRKNKPEHQKVEYIPELYPQDALEFLDSIEDNSVDLLFTDPPYMKDIEMEISLFANQWCPNRLNSFIKNKGKKTHTVRLERDSGAVTEFRKRLIAIENEYEFPVYTIQSYVSDRENGTLLSLAIAKTKDLILFIKKGKSGYHYDINKVDKNGRALFYYVKWELFINYHELIVWPPDFIRKSSQGNLSKFFD